MTTATRRRPAPRLSALGRTGIRRASSTVKAHPIWAVFLLALTLRIAVALAIAIVHPHDLSADTIGYSQLAAAKAQGHSGAWSPYFHWLYERTATLLVPITALYELFGVHQLLGQLYVALLGAGTAAVVTRLAIEVLPERWALIAGLTVALLPSQVIWSSLILKDPPVWILLAALALTVAVAGRTQGVRLFGLAVIAAVLLILLGYLRLQTLVVACWALMLAAPFGRRPWRIRRSAGAIALGICLPWFVFNLQPAGLRVLHLQPPPAVQRCKNSAGAQSATTKGPGVQHIVTGSEQSLQRLNTACTRIANADNQNGLGANISYLPHGLLVMLAQPYPWGHGSTYLRLAGADELIWYPLLGLAMIGLVSLRRRHLRVMAFPLLAGGAILILYAITEGNVGTAFRHRGEFEWVVVILACLGLLWVSTWRSGRRQVSVDSTITVPDTIDAESSGTG